MTTEKPIKKPQKSIPQVTIANGAMYWINVGMYIGIGMALLSLFLVCPLSLLIIVLS